MSAAHPGTIVGALCTLVCTGIAPQQSSTHQSYTTHLQIVLHSEPAEKSNLERRQRGVVLDVPGSGRAQCECCAPQHNRRRIMQLGSTGIAPQQPNTRPAHTTNLQSPHGEPVEKSDLERGQRGVVSDVPGSGRTQCECCASQHNRRRTMHPGMYWDSSTTTQYPSVAHHKLTRCRSR